MINEERKNDTNNDIENILGPFSIKVSLSGLEDIKLKMDSNHHIQNAHPLCGGA